MDLRGRGGIYDLTLPGVAEFRAAVGEGVDIFCGGGEEEKGGGEEGEGLEAHCDGVRGWEGVVEGDGGGSWEIFILIGG